MAFSHKRGQTLTGCFFKKITEKNMYNCNLHSLLFSTASVHIVLCWFFLTVFFVDVVMSLKDGVCPQSLSGILILYGVQSMFNLSFMTFIVSVKVFLSSFVWQVPSRVTHIRACRGVRCRGQLFWCRPLKSTRGQVGYKTAISHYSHCVLLSFIAFHWHVITEVILSHNL